MRHKIIFYYMNERCHATIVNDICKVSDIVNNPNRYIGEINGYEIYSMNVLFNQFGFVAIKGEN